MAENAENIVDLFDYLRVILKRGRLIIVVTLVCIGVGVGIAVKKEMSAALPTLYQADVLLKIGQRVIMNFTTPAPMAPMEVPEDLVEIIPLMHDERINETAGYSLDVKPIGKNTMVRITLRGPDKGVEGILREIVDLLIDEHRIKAESSYVAYKNFIKKLEEDAIVLQENIFIIESTIVKMKHKEKKFMEYMKEKDDREGKEGEEGEEVEEEKEEKEEEYIGDRSVIWNMLYLKTIDKEIDLREARQNLRDIKWKHLVHRTIIGNMEDNFTRVIGEIKITVIETPVRKTHNTIITAGVVGLIMSLFIAFLMEYIEETKLRLKRNGKVDSV